MYPHPLSKSKDSTHTYLTTKEHTSSPSHSKYSSGYGRDSHKIKHTIWLASSSHPHKISLPQRYVTVLPKKKPKKLNPNNNYQTLHMPTLNILIEAYQITHYYSSPLTCPTQHGIIQFGTQCDIIFDSFILAKSSKWMGVGIAHLPN